MVKDGLRVFGFWAGGYLRIELDLEVILRKLVDPSVLPAIESILATGTLGDAAEFLGITDARFSRLRTRIRQLGKCFMTGDDHIPKQRRPYKKRAKAVATPSPVAA